MPRKSGFGAFTFAKEVIVGIVIGAIILIVYYFVTKNTNDTKNTPSSSNPSPGPTNYSSSDFTKIADDQDWFGVNFNGGKSNGPASSLSDCVALFNKAINSGIKPEPTFFTSDGDSTGKGITQCSLKYTNSTTPLQSRTPNSNKQGYMLTSVLQKSLSFFTHIKDTAYNNTSEIKLCLVIDSISLSNLVCAKILTDWNLENSTDKATFFQNCSNYNSTGRPRLILARFNTGFDSKTATKTSDPNTQTFILNG
jgi:hypothetical protein